MPVCAINSRKYRHYIGNRHYSAYYHCWLLVVTICAKRFHGRYSGQLALLNRRHRETTAAPGIYCRCFSVRVGCTVPVPRRDSRIARSICTVCSSPLAIFAMRMFLVAEIGNLPVRPSNLTYKVVHRGPARQRISLALHDTTTSCSTRFLMGRVEVIRPDS